MPNLACNPLHTYSGYKSKLIIYYIFGAFNGWSSIHSLSNVKFNADFISVTIDDQLFRVRAQFHFLGW